MPTFIALPQARTWGTDVLLGEAVERRRTAGVSASAAARSPAPAPAAAQPQVSSGDGAIL